MSVWNLIKAGNFRLQIWKNLKVLASLRKLQAMELNKHERHCVQLHFDFLQLQSHLITENASFTSSKFRLVECINLGIFYKYVFDSTFLGIFLFSFIRVQAKFKGPCGFDKERFLVVKKYQKFGESICNGMRSMKSRTLKPIFSV